MPLRAIRKRCTTDNALTVAIAATTASHELASLLAFPPAIAASGILLAIFKTIQDLQTNKRECFRLAKRCVTLLTDVKDAMEGHWDDAPEALLKNLAKFERILESLHEDLKRDVDGKWHDRLLRKSAIERELIEYHAMVDDAARSFQIVTLIHIHRAVGVQHAQVLKSKTMASSERASDEMSLISRPAPPYSPAKSTGTVDTAVSESPLAESFSAMSLSSMSSSAAASSVPRSSTDSEYVLISEPSSTTSALTSPTSLRLISQSSESLSSSIPLVNSPTQTDSLEDEEDFSTEEQAFLAELALFDGQGFPQYDYTSIRPDKGKGQKISTGWWAGAREVEIDKRKALMLPYAANDTLKGRLRAAQRWLRDVKTLQNVYHPNLPTLIGYSGTDAPTPFILLADVQTRLPQALLLSTLANTSLLECTKLLIGFYKETLDAALYLQRQLSLTESKTQDYVEHASFRISPHSEKRVIMGLPDPEAHIAGMQSWRNFGLAWSVRGVWTAVLPNRGRVDRLVDLYDPLEADKQIKANHFALLARTLLPGNDAPEAAEAHLEALARTIEPPAEKHEDEEGDEIDDFIALYDTGSEGSSPASQPSVIDDKLTLKKLRQVALQAGTHGVAWGNNFVPPHLFRVGDIGYIRPEGVIAEGDQDGRKPEALWSYGGFDRFVRVCNVFDEQACIEMTNAAKEAEIGRNLDVKQDNSGWTSSFEHGRFEKTELQVFDAGGGILGWPIITSPGSHPTVHMVHCSYTANVSDAWSLLLSHAPDLAKQHGVQPEDLMLVTRSGTEYRVKVRDIRSAPLSFHTPSHHFPSHQLPFPQRPGFPGQQRGFPGHPHGGFAPPPPLPSYIFTSEAHGFEPRLQDTPVCIPHQPPPSQQHGARCIWGMDGVYGFMNYAKLCAEDFV